MPQPTMISSLDALSDGYQAILCDVWGVVHNGVRAFPSACAALAARARAGLAVVLITNAPRPQPRRRRAARNRSACRPDAWDAVVTSGDVTRDLIAAGPRKIFTSAPIATFRSMTGSTSTWSRNSRRPRSSAPGCSTTRPRCPEDYAATLRRFRARDLPFICANPDIVVERGDRADLVRRRAGARLCAARRPHADFRQAAPADLRGGAEGGGRGARPRGRPRATCWRSATAC